MARPCKIFMKCDFDEALGDMLYKMRQKRGLSQLEVAEKIGIRKGCMSRYERGVTTMPVHVLYNLSRFYGFSIDEAIKKAARK